tara:strand:- start:493 stop:1740 length:1248 start_codon:yes stop_codon:yes gene_type:complete
VINKISRLFGILGFGFLLIISSTALSNSSFEIYPSIFEDRLVQTRFQSVFNVNNTASGERTYSIEPASFINSNNCEIDYDFDFPPTISVNPNIVTLQEGEAAEIAIVGEYDPEILNGFYGALLVTDITEFEQTNEVNFRGRAAATFRLRGPEPWDVEVQPKVSNVTQNGQNEIRYNLDIENTGKVDIIVGGLVEANFNGQIISVELPEERIYPGLCARLSTLIDYSSTDFIDGEVTFNAIPRVQTYKSTDSRNQILEFENLNFSSSFQFEKGAVAGNNYEIKLFDVQEVIEDGKQALLVQYRLENIGKLSGSPSVKIIVGEPGEVPDVAGKTYSSLNPGNSAEGEALFFVEEGIYDVTLELFENESTFETQNKRQTVLGQSSAFDNRLLLLLIPLIYLIYLVFSQRRKIQELEEK